jgi:hypothetical protein
MFSLSVITPALQSSSPFFALVQRSTSPSRHNRRLLVEDGWHHRRHQCPRNAQAKSLRFNDPRLAARSRSLHQLHYLIGFATGKIPSLLSETFGGKKRDPQGLVGVVGVAQASAQTVSDSKLAWNERIATFIMIIASLNIFSGNLRSSPLLPLDGGHMAIAIADGARNIWARIRRRQTPRPIDVETLTPITIVVFIFLAALSILLLAADIFNPVHFNL